MKGGGSSHTNYTRTITIGGNITDSVDDCSTIVFETNLQNIQPVLAKYVKGDELKVELDNSGNIQAVGVYGVCGYITHLESEKLIKCIKNGNKFKAAIKDITSSSCTVIIRIRII